MSRVVQKHWCYFQLLITTTSVTQKKHLINIISSEQLKALVQIANNSLQHVLTVKPSKLVLLKKHKRFIRFLGDKSIGLKQKKTLLCRQGKALTLFLKSIEPSLKSYVK